MSLCVSSCDSSLGLNCLVWCPLHASGKSNYPLLSVPCCPSDFTVGCSFSSRIVCTCSLTPLTRQCNFQPGLFWALAESDVLASSLPVVADFIWFSVQAGAVKQLTTTPQRVSVPLSALPLPEDSTALFQWFFVNCGLRPRFSDLFPQPRAQLQLSTSTCVPHLVRVWIALDVPPLVPATIFHVNFTLIASGICFKALFQVWLLAEAMLQHAVGTFPKDSTDLVQLCHSVNYVLRPRSFRVISAATCPAAALHVSVPYLVDQDCARRSFFGSSHHFVTQAPLAPGVLTFLQFCKMCPQPGASHSFPVNLTVFPKPCSSFGFLPQPCSNNDSRVTVVLRSRCLLVNSLANTVCHLVLFASLPSVILVSWPVRSRGCRC